MRAFLLAIVGLVLASSSSAQVPARTVANTSENKNNEKQTGTCIVSGQVITAAEGTPLKSSRVALMGQDASSRSQVFSAATDGDGRFEIKKVAPGRYTFLATHSGYLTQSYQSRGIYGGTTLRLAPGQQIGDALFRLVRGAVVTGRVVDESEEPLAKIGVTALRKRSPEEMEDLSPRMSKDRLIWSSTAQSDDRGEYRIFDLMPGEYYIRASGADFGLGSEDGMDWATRTSVGSQYAASFYPGVIQLDQAQTVVLSPGEEVRAEFAMRHVKTVEVSGHILAVDGSGAPNASVMLIAPELGRWGTRTQREHWRHGGIYDQERSPRRIRAHRAATGSGKTRIRAPETGSRQREYRLCPAYLQPGHEHSWADRVRGCQSSRERAD